MQNLDYKLIVSDFDGTLVNEDGTISDKNKKGLKIAGYGDGDAIFTGAEEIDAKLSAGEDVTVVANWEVAKVYIDVTVKAEQLEEIYSKYNLN